MFLAVDIGNTNIHIGVLDGRGVVDAWRLSTRIDRTADEYSLIAHELFGLAEIPTSAIDSAGVCSVSPRTTRNMVESLESSFKVAPIVVSASSRTNLRFDYELSSIGGDRIADAVAARQQYPGSAVVVVDAGTGLVFDAISAAGVYLGGAIAPGLDLAANALSSKTGLLPNVSMSIPDFAIGKDTEQSMRSGLLLGAAELIKGMLARFKQELSPSDPSACRSILTGGYGSTISKLCPGFDTVDEALTLKGLKAIYELNKG